MIKAREKECHSCACRNLKGEVTNCHSRERGNPEKKCHPCEYSCTNKEETNEINLNKLIKEKKNEKICTYSESILRGNEFTR